MAACEPARLSTPWRGLVVGGCKPQPVRQPARAPHPVMAYSMLA